MSYLVDSDWLADYLKGKAAAVQLFQGLAERALFMSIVSYGEIYEGIVFGQDRAKHETGFAALLRWVDVLALDEETMRRFAFLRGDLRQNGMLIGDFDLLIAATALRHDLTLVTRNVRHFQRIAELPLWADK